MNFRFSLLPFFLLTLLLALGACKKDDKNEPAPDFTERDEQLITQYIQANNLTGFVRDTTMFVSVTQAGTGALPKKGQTIIVKYKGTTLDGQVFDETKESTIGFPFVLGAGQVIKGWDRAFKQFNKGTKAILLIPSGLAYGNTATGSIPANSVLRFDVEVVNIK
ncbi:FKBP-type peptidyl-prolyl cis-trans isomerase [Hymenobacter sp. ISL-91]|uniref:FKBP-type peptidyl-prolyl cis-trans isomerase n=1 Tax=Hymenobacter sp. ISL-91 TaxID=2819151 RepID=UPI001BE6580A|nr:FKBP-type peptidyl-prolyl cis-trans isomerase [Hymenobacter sp. ISL-91]MBT2558675.1 FKBP-type peptidyl-prolyl cis-trans isomerase [Hymenobacter sp. ISL-91]